MFRLLAFCAGIGFGAVSATLPSIPIYLALCVATGLVCWLFPPDWRWPGYIIIALLLGWSYSSWRTELRLAEALPNHWQQKPITFIGTVRDLPSTGIYGTQFTMSVEQTLTPGAQLPSMVHLKNAGKSSWPTGSRWQLTARFKRYHGPGNPFGLDAEQWQWAKGLLASGSIVKHSVQRLPDQTDFLSQVDRQRETIVHRLQMVFGTEKKREAALIAALTVGAQQEIAKEDWRRFSQTGLTHLISISGLHITLFAALAATFASLIVRRLPPLRVPPRILIALAAFGAATVYALLAGFSVPTQRTLFMLAVGLLALCWRRQLSPFRIWSIALTVVLVIDPFAVLTPGLWLSFGMVAALMITSIGRRRPAAKWKLTLAGQWAATVCTIAPLIAWFGQFPLVSPIANAVAIPYISILITPLALLAVTLPWDPLLHITAWLIKGFYWWVTPLASWPMLTLARAPTLLLVLGIIGAVWLIAPRGLAGRALGFCLLAPMLLYQPAPIPPSQLRVTAFDIGQGLSVLIQTTHHTLLFDTGAWEGERVVLPQLYGLGITKLDKLILSHHDNDHDGAAVDIAKALPIQTLLAGQPDSLAEMHLSGKACQQGMRWIWDGITFDILAPSVFFVAKEDNAHSCVLRVANAHHAVMIMGDAPTAVEEQLIQRASTPLKSTVLIAGHHGSNTSTSQAWLEAVDPQFVLFSAGYLNRYRHPHPKVIQRAQNQNSRILRTDQDGAIQMDIGQTIRIHCWRTEAKRTWRLQGRCGEQ